ncbi:MAG: histidine kinase [Cyclobacteriaceae bacterium]|nr:histidine kinase [Cyclobacteriaceae bacterium]
MRGYFTISTIFLLFILSGSSQAQEKEESKKNSYKSLKSRSSPSSIQQLLQEATALKNTNPSQSLSNIQEALGMSLAQGDVFQEARCYLMLGEINEGIQEWSLALDNYEKAYQKLRSQFEKTAEYNRALQGLGITNLKLGNYQAALAYFQQTLSLRLSADELIERTLDISEVYYQMGSYTKALEAIEEITVNVQKDVVASKVQNQKAKIYARLNEVDKANDYYQSSQRNLRAAGSAVPKKDEELAMQSTKEEISEVLREQKRYDEDISLRNQSIDYNLESNNLKEVSKDKIELSKSLAAKGETGKAIRELEEAATLADTINNPKEQANAFLALADLFEKNGRPTEALATYKKYSEAMSRNEQMNQIVVQEKAELIKKQKEIEELTKTIALGQQEEQTTLQRQRLIIYGLVLILLIITVTSFLIYKNAQASKRANQLLALKSLRSQMNPHFIFNALNSVNQFISQNDERTANKFLTEFSRLMRLVLENSQEDFITLQKEEEIISLYVKLEHYRFRDKFDYSIEVDPELNKESIELPPMLIQPYIENAVWHGLRYKEEKGKLDIRLRKRNGYLQILIEDDGIGRTRSTQLKTPNQKRHNSTGLKNIQERLSILNTVYKTNYQVTTEDSTPDSGTRVTISIPIQNGKV